MTRHSRPAVIESDAITAPAGRESPRPHDHHHPGAEANVRRSLRRAAKAAGLDPKRWTPRELRLSFVSIASALGLTLEQIADLVGHAGTVVTEKVYRHQLRPMLMSGAEIMDRLFGVPPETPEATSTPWWTPWTDQGPLPVSGSGPLTCGGRYWDRTSDLSGVNGALSR